MLYFGQRCPNKEAGAKDHNPEQGTAIGPT